MKFILFIFGAFVLPSTPVHAWLKDEYCENETLHLVRAIAPRRSAGHIDGLVLTFAKAGQPQAWVSAYEGITPLPYPNHRPGDEALFVLEILENGARTKVAYENRCWEGSKELFQRWVRVVSLSSRLAKYSGLREGSEIELNCYETDLNFRPFECAP